MAQAVLERIIGDLDKLEIGELRRVGAEVAERLRGEEEPDKVEAFHNALQAAGLVREIKPRYTGPMPPRRQITPTGRPLSEIIIEERR